MEKENLSYDELKQYCRELSIMLQTIYGMTYAQQDRNLSRTQLEETLAKIYTIAGQGYNMNAELAQSGLWK